MSILHNLQNIPLKIHLPIEISIMKDLHRYFLPLILLHTRRHEIEVLLYRLPREGNLLVDPRTVFRQEIPVCRPGWDEAYNEEEGIGDPSCSEGEEAGDEVRCDEDDGPEVEVGEGGGTFSGKRGIGDSGIGGAGP